MLRIYMVCAFVERDLLSLSPSSGNKHYMRIEM